MYPRACYTSVQTIFASDNFEAQFHAQRAKKRCNFHFLVLSILCYDGIKEFYCEAITNILAMTVESTSQFSPQPHSAAEIVNLDSTRKFAEMVVGGEPADEDCEHPECPKGQKSMKKAKALA